MGLCFDFFFFFFKTRGVFLSPARTAGATTGEARGRGGGGQPTAAHPRSAPPRKPSAGKTACAARSCAGSCRLPRERLSLASERVRGMCTRVWERKGRELTALEKRSGQAGDESFKCTPEKVPCSPKGGEVALFKQEEKPPPTLPPPSSSATLRVSCLPCRDQHEHPPTHLSPSTFKHRSPITGEVLCVMLHFWPFFSLSTFRAAPLYSADTYFCFIHNLYRMSQNAAEYWLFLRISVFLFLYESFLSTRTGNLAVIGLLPFVKNTDADCLGSKNKSILSSKAFLHSSCFFDNAM